LPESHRQGPPKATRGSADGAESHSQRSSCRGDTGEIITVLSRQRLRARRGNEERRDRKEIDDDES